MSAPTLKDQLAELCYQHGLTALSVGISVRANSEPYFCAYAHDGPRAEMGISANPADCIALAIDELNKARYISPVIAELVAA